MTSQKSTHPALYRVTQFFTALKAYLPVWAGGVRAELSAADQTLVESVLTVPLQQQLFKRMPPNDRRHAVAVARSLQDAGYHQPALIQAALLHDVGKTIGQPIIHRVLIVLFETFWPVGLDWLSGRSTNQMRDLLPTIHYSSGVIYHSFSWWRRPFVVHAYHPDIGAAWAEAVNCDPLAVDLIRKHQDDRPEAGSARSAQQELLAALQWADNLN